MSREDRRTVVKSLALAIFLIAVLVAAPFAWLAVTADGQSGGRAAEITSENAITPN